VLYCSTLQHFIEPQKIGLFLREFFLPTRPLFDDGVSIKQDRGSAGTIFSGTGPYMVFCVLNEAINSCNIKVTNGKVKKNTPRL
jgi:hypothetical protein